MHFNSHVERLADAAVGLVNALTPGMDGGRPVRAPEGEALVRAVAAAVAGPGYDGRCTLRQAEELRPWVGRCRDVIELLARADHAEAARLVNVMLEEAGARPRLDPDAGGVYHLHFHGPDDTFVRGWAAGLAAGLAMIAGGDLLHRLGVCEAPGCDRVWVDRSKNTHRRFCSQRCQSRVKAAAYRTRRR